MGTTQGALTACRGRTRLRERAPLRELRERAPLAGAQGTRTTRGSARRLQGTRTAQGKRPSGTHTATHTARRERTPRGKRATPMAPPAHSTILAPVLPLDALVQCRCWHTIRITRSASDSTSLG